MSDKHDQFASKNLSMSRAFEAERRTKEKEKEASAAPKIGICESCKKEKPLRAYRSNERGRTEGAASFGVVIKRLCEECRPKGKDRMEKEVPTLKPSQIKSMLRGAKKGLF